MRIEEIPFYAGMLLSCIGILGGGIDSSQIKIPPLTAVTRFLCFLGGIIFIALGLFLNNKIPLESINAINKNISISTKSNVENTSPSDTNSIIDLANTKENDTAKTDDENLTNTNDISFKILAKLGKNQANQHIHILIDGEDMGTMDLDEKNPNDEMTVTLPQEGEYSYTIETKGLFNKENSAEKLNGAGQGKISVIDNDFYELASNVTGSTWLVDLRRLDKPKYEDLEREIAHLKAEQKKQELEKLKQKSSEKNGTSETATQIQSNLKTEPTQPEKISQSEQATEDPIIETGKKWTGDWGDEIIATMSTEPCDIPEFIELDYKYAMSVSIPIARLKKPTDAWHSDNDRAETIMGCWFRTSGLSIHAKMIRKSDNRVTDQDFRLDDGSWNSE